MTKKVFKCGFIAIIGKTNAGKSTLLNKILAKKIAPVSKKAQTTRQVIYGIRNDPDTQMIFVDTPGFHAPKDVLGTIMIRELKQSFTEADLVFFLVDPKAPDRENRQMIDELSVFKGPVFLVLNKIDLFRDKQEMLPILEEYQKLFAFKELIPVSAEKELQLDVLLEMAKKYLPEGPPCFPEDMISNRSSLEIIKELIREKVVRFTGQEIPYVTDLKVDQFEYDEAKQMFFIKATIFVDKDSQKGIVIGKQGEKLKQIGQDARLEVEQFLGKKVYLGLWVKVLKGWKNDPSRLRDLGYDA